MSKFRVGTEWCYADFDSKEDADKYRFRRFPLEFLRSLCPADGGILCEIGIHKNQHYVDGPDGGGGLREYQFCLRCFRGKAVVGHPSCREVVFDTYKDSP